MLIGNSFNLAADISLLIFQYFENPIDGKRNDLVDPELIIRFKIYSRIRLVSKSWYKFEYLSRCRWCSSRYITNSYNKISGNDIINKLIGSGGVIKADKIKIVIKECLL